MIKSVTHDEDHKSDMLSSVTSYLHIRQAATVADGDQFSCSSDTNALGPAAISSTVFRVESEFNRLPVNIV